MNRAFLRLTDAMRFLPRLVRRDAKAGHKPPDLANQDSCDELELYLRETRAHREQLRREVLEAVARLDELSRRAPRGR